PIDPGLRNPSLGALSPIRVVNVVFAAGDGNRGVQTAAYNLPNDERVVQEKGSKRVMLKNMQEAKFKKALLPIARVALPLGAGAGQGRGGGPHTRDHDRAGGGRLRGGQGDARQARGGASGGAARARSPAGRTRGHRAAVRDRGRAVGPGTGGAASGSDAGGVE